MMIMMVSNTEYHNEYHVNRMFLRNWAVIHIKGACKWCHACITLSLVKHVSAPRLKICSMSEELSYLIKEPMHIYVYKLWKALNLKSTCKLATTDPTAVWQPSWYIWKFFLLLHVGAHLSNPEEETTYERLSWTD